MVDVMMRVPPILVIDEILKIGMGLPTRLYPSPNDSQNVESQSKGLESIIDASSAGGILNNVTAAITTQSSIPELPEISAASDIASTLDLVLKNTTTAAASFFNASTLAAGQAIANSTTMLNTPGGAASSTFGVIIEELATDADFADILSLTSTKFLICLMGQ